MPLNPAGEPTPQQIHTEATTDPAGLYGGKSYVEIFDAMIVLRNNVIVTRTSAENVRGETAPGNNDARVNDILPVQLLRDQVDPDEYRSNVWGNTGADQVELQNRSSIAERLMFYLAGSAGESQFVFTDEFKAIVLRLFPAANADTGNWPVTRANLDAIQTRDGSRSEMLWGVQISRAQFDEANEYGLSLEPPQPIGN